MSGWAWWMPPQNIAKKPEKGGHIAISFALLGPWLTDKKAKKKWLTICAFLSFLRCGSPIDPWTSQETVAHYCEGVFLHWTPLWSGMPPSGERAARTIRPADPGRPPCPLSFPTFGVILDHGRGRLKIWFERPKNTPQKYWRNRN